MADERIILSGIWVALMLTYLLGDVLRLFTGDMKGGEIDGQPASQAMLVGIAIIMLVPIVMVLLSLIVAYPAIRWINIVVAVIFFLFNLAGLPYEGAYDNFLIGVGFVLTASRSGTPGTGWFDAQAGLPKDIGQSSRSGNRHASRCAENFIASTGGSL